MTIGAEQRLCQPSTMLALYNAPDPMKVVLEVEQSITAIMKEVAE